MSDREHDDLEAHEVLQVAQRAMARCSELEQTQQKLIERIEELEDDVVANKLAWSEHAKHRDYRILELDTKVGRVREELWRRATEGRGRSLDYSDIRDGLFDGHPSANHCYRLMELAARADGFELQEQRRPKRLVIHPERVRQSTAFLSGNKTESRRARSK